MNLTTVFDNRNGDETLYSGYNLLPRTKEQDIIRIDKDNYVNNIYNYVDLRSSMYNGAFIDINKVIGNADVNGVTQLSALFTISVPIEEILAIHNSPQYIQSVYPVYYLAIDQETRALVHIGSLSLQKLTRPVYYQGSTYSTGYAVVFSVLVNWPRMFRKFEQIVIDIIDEQTVRTGKVDINRTTYTLQVIYSLVRTSLFTVPIQTILSIKKKEDHGFRHIGITHTVENYSGIIILPREFPVYEAWVNNRRQSQIHIMFGAGYMLRTGLAQKEVNKLAFTVHRINVAFG